MAILEVLTFPDPVLRKKSEKVVKVTPELKKIAQDMLETMYASKGIGLAAVQVGHLVRLLVLDVRPKDDDGKHVVEDMRELEQKLQYPLVLFNPEIIHHEGKTSYNEGCLSVPTYHETVDRADLIEVKALDINGKEIRFEADGLLSICLQHEIDHLDGKLFIDRLSTVKSMRIKNKVKKYGYPSKEEQDEMDEEYEPVEVKKKK